MMMHLFHPAQIAALYEKHVKSEIIDDDDSEVVPNMLTPPLPPAQIALLYENNWWMIMRVPMRSS